MIYSQQDYFGYNKCYEENEMGCESLWQGNFREDGQGDPLCGTHTGAEGWTIRRRLPGKGPGKWFRAEGTESTKALKGLRKRWVSLRNRWPVWMQYGRKEGSSRDEHREKHPTALSKLDTSQRLWYLMCDLGASGAPEHHLGLRSQF